MSANRKLTDWFTPAASSQGSSSSSRFAPSVGRTSKPRPASKSTSIQPGSKSSTARKASPTTSPAGPSLPSLKSKPPAHLVVDLDDNSFDVDSSIELISAPTSSRNQVSSFGNSKKRSITEPAKAVRPVPNKLDTTSHFREHSRGKSPLVIDISSDALTPSTASPKSAITLSDDSSDVNSITKRQAVGAPTSQSKKRRISSLKAAKKRVVSHSSSDDAEEKHVEIKLTMPSSNDNLQHPSSADEMDWAPTPSASQVTPIHPSPPQLPTPSPRSTSDRSTPDATMSGVDSDDHMLKIRNLPRRARSVTTPPTSVSPYSQPETAEAIIARMRAKTLESHDTILSNDEEEDTRALAAALAGESSDNDDDDEFVFGSIGNRASPKSSYVSSLCGLLALTEVAYRASKPQAVSHSGLFSSSSLSSAPEGDGNEDIAMTEADDSDSSETPAIRRSLRVVSAPKPIVPIAPTLKPRKKQSEFDRLFAEDTRRKRSRGGADGYQRADTLATANADSSSDEEADSDVELDPALAVVGPNDRNSEGSDDSLARVGNMAQKLLGDEITADLRNMIQTNPAGVSKLKRKAVNGSGDDHYVRAGRRLWDRATTSIEVGLLTDSQSYLITYSLHSSLSLLGSSLMIHWCLAFLWL